MENRRKPGARRASLRNHRVFPRQPRGTLLRFRLCRGNGFSLLKGRRSSGRSSGAVTYLGGRKWNGFLRFRRDVLFCFLILQTLRDIFKTVRFTPQPEVRTRLHPSDFIFIADALFSPALILSLGS